MFNNFEKNTYDFFGREREKSQEALSDLTRALKHGGAAKSSRVRPVRDCLKESGLVMPDVSNFSSGLEKPEEEGDGVMGVGGFDVEEVGLKNSDKNVEMKIKKKLNKESESGSVKPGESCVRVAVSGVSEYSDVKELEVFGEGKKLSVRPNGWKDCLGEILSHKGKYILSDYSDDNEYDDIKEAAKAMWNNFIKDSEVKAKNWYKFIGDK